jgi:hypothetical protein
MQMHAKLVRAILTIAAVATLIAAPSQAQADWVGVRERFEDLPMPYRNLVERAFRGVESRFGSVSPHDPQSILAALVDLNEDGRNEALLVFSSHLYCGNTPWCDAGLYELQEGDVWRMIGSISVPQSPGTDAITMIFIEEETHEGWHVLSTGAARYCWTDAPDPQKSALHSDPFYAIGRADDDPGYFAVVNIGQPCP